MHWYVGIDEAGYGPSLGPFVMALTAVGFNRKCDDGESCWDLLAPLIGKAEGRNKSKASRLIVDDSKKINGMANGRSLLGKPWRTLFDHSLPSSLAINDFLSRVDCIGREELVQEVWWIADEPVNLQKIEVRSPEPNDIYPKFKAKLLVQNVKNFNQICRENGSKAAVSARAWTLLMRSFLESLGSGESIRVITDKHGGRNQYGRMIDNAFEKDEWIVPEREHSNESVYRVFGTNLDIGFWFMPRAESVCPMVALASMLAKHLREEAMQIFNKWWSIHVSGLRPTAGYPGDARRFIETIQPVANQMGIGMDEIVRVK